MASLPSIPVGSLSAADGFTASSRPVSRSSSPTGVPGSRPAEPIAAPLPAQLDALFPGPDGRPQLGEIDSRMLLELADGSSFEGFSFGANKSITGECVFQTGMVGYPESLTDPSYAGQILVLTYPLIGSYGVPARPKVDAKDLPIEFESNKIHVAGLIVGNYSGAGDDFSNHAAESELGQWLKEEGIPAIFGVDTRDLTKKLRERGSTVARMSVRKSGAPHDLGLKWREAYEEISYHDNNSDNLVAQVSIQKPRLYAPTSTPLLHPSGRVIRVMVVDVGMKFNQIRCFIKRGVEIKLVPWNYDYLAPGEEAFDGLFVSNGPGDPALLTETVAILAKAVALGTIPIFGICLGHQLLARASGASTLKLKYGNRGANIPCTNLVSGRCYITSQNHGYAVNTRTLQPGWKELFVNANDGSNEGIYSTEHPFFSVQFHPESAPGPRDTEFLFDTFIEAIQKAIANPAPKGGKLVGPVVFPGGIAAENSARNPRVSVKKVLVLGSGGLSIGQAGEFDYSGSQAIKALKEEGIYTILINPNIATIQTSKGLADKVYFLPVTADSVRKVIEHERPDGIYVTFGGQTALGVGIELKDEFEGLGVRVLGTPIQTVITTEDRELFDQALKEIGEKTAQSAACNTVEECIAAANEIGYPVIARAAFALGGLGSGFAYSEPELVELVTRSFATSPQVLVEKSMKGWKEVEYEVVRDCNDNCITVCNMENFDPLGIHTGDSIVVAPSQTLSDADYQMLRTTAVNVIRHLGVVGECNIQYALNPHSQEYCIIEVNARLSRSSALASKATGYPLAFIAAKLGLNIPLNEIRNSVTKETTACFEPSLDYCVVKFPRWDLKKFTRVSPYLSSAMKSVGEVMAIGKTFEETIQKAIRAIDPSFFGFGTNGFKEDIDYELTHPTDQRIFALANALSQGRSVEELHKLTNIDKWFLNKLAHIMQVEKILQKYSAPTIPAALLKTAKQLGFADVQLARLLNSNELAVRRVRLDYGITPRVKQIDTVAAEFPAFTNYLYTTYNGSNHDVTFEDKGIMVLGSGVYRIGSSVEFDWCAVRAIRTIRQRGFKTIMVNYNPETVSTDYDEADKLYFETISLETILDIYEAESSAGVVVSMGGQTSNNIALPLHRQGVKVLGTSPEMIDMAENRYKFSRMLDKLGVDQPLWKELSTLTAAHEFCDRVGYPVLVRPSYVLSGAAMNVVYSKDDLDSYLGAAVAVSREHPVVVTKYIEDAKEIEMDAVGRDGKMVMHYISEHVENAGVHSGDATLIQPPQDLDPETVRRVEEATAKIGAALNISGPYNIQFIAKNNEIKVIECNVRAARSLPFVSKVTGVDAIELATDVMLGLPITPYPPTNMPPNYVGIKVPQFSFGRLAGADPILGVEMASTGEVACFGYDKYEAYLKALLSTGMKMPKKNVLFSIGSFKEKLEMLPSVQKLAKLGYNIFATSGTADFLQEHGMQVKYLEALEDDDDGAMDQKSEYSLKQHIANHMIDLYINLPSKNRYRRPASYMSKGYRSRRMAVDFAIPLVTNVKCAKLLIEALARKPSLAIASLDYKTSHETLTLPPFIGSRAFVPNAGPASNDVAEVTQAALSAGFTTTQFLPLGLKANIEDGATLEAARATIAGQSLTDFTLSIAATPDNASKLTPEVASSSKALLLPFTNVSGVSGAVNKVAAVAQHFSSWPEDKPIVTDAKTTDLASVLLLASLHNRSIHVTNVVTQDDINLIALSKAKDLKVTCDVSVYTLFFTKEAFPGATGLPSAKDQAALWDNLETIDTFSVGTLPYRLATELNKAFSPAAGWEESIRLLLSAVHDGRLTLEDITTRLSDNPREIFGLPPADPNSYVEVELDRSSKVAKKSYWSPLEGQVLAGSIHRVVVRGETAFLDGAFAAPKANGRDLSLALGESAMIKTSERKARFSMSNSRPSLTSLGFSSKPYEASPITPPQSFLGANPRSPKVGSAKSPQLAATTSVSDAGQPSIMSLAAPSTVSAQPRALVGPTSHLSALVSNASAYTRRHVLSVRAFNRDDLHTLFGVASEMRMLVERHVPIEILKGRVLCTAFYEPSTRTSCSFEAAMGRLGGQVVGIDSATSSVTKGESLADTVRTLGCYGDALVLRHPAAGSAQTAAKYSPVPVINAGDGIGEHPTQAFLDIYTIREELGTVNGLTITMVGDLKNGRTVHSLVKLLSLYSVSLNFVSPASLSMPESVKNEAIKAGIPVVETTSLASVIGSTDVLYVTRVQSERFTDVAEYERVKDAYVINNAMLALAKPHTIVMHPLPRNAELDPEVDFDQRRACYFRQMRYGLFIRMALLALVIGTNPSA